MIVLSWLLIHISIAQAFDLLSVGAGIAALAGLSKIPYCKFNECCNDEWINKTVDLKDLSAYIYGQEHILKIAHNSIERHVSNKHPSKPLVMVLSGPPGTGKNYFAELVAKRLFHLGTLSKYVKIVIGTQHFIKERTKDEYQQMLVATMKNLVSKCPKRTLFIFDEIDKFPEGVTDVLKPYFDRYDKIDGIDFRHSIFILIGNRGQSAISEFVFKNFKNGIDRSQIPQHQLEHIVKSVIYYNPSNSTDLGMYHSRLIENGLIDIFLPFYPLERRHLLRCIEWEVAQLQMSMEHISVDLEECAGKIMKYIEFYPEDNPIFSLDGCKKINFLTNTFCY